MDGSSERRPSERSQRRRVAESVAAAAVPTAAIGDCPDVVASLAHSLAEPTILDPPPPESVSAGVLRCGHESGVAGHSTLRFLTCSASATLLSTRRGVDTASTVTHYGAAVASTETVVFVDASTPTVAAAILHDGGVSGGRQRDTAGAGRCARARHGGHRPRIPGARRAGGVAGGGDTGRADCGHEAAHRMDARNRPRHRGRVRGPLEHHLEESGGQGAESGAPRMAQAGLAVPLDGIRRQPAGGR
eukprot:ctg_1194.g263